VKIKVALDFAQLFYKHDAFLFLKIAYIDRPACIYIVSERKYTRELARFNGERVPEILGGTDREISTAETYRKSYS